MTFPLPSAALPQPSLTAQVPMPAHLSLDISACEKNALFKNVRKLNEDIHNGPPSTCSRYWCLRQSFHMDNEWFTRDIEEILPASWVPQTRQGTRYGLQTVTLTIVTPRTPNPQRALAYPIAFPANH